MRKNGYTYGDLAKLWGLSESSVKRIMSREDLSFERIHSLSDWLGYPLHELLRIAQQDGSELHHFTETQDEFLATHPEAAYLYLRLTIGQSLEEYAREHGVAPRALQRRLYELERVGLVENLAGDRVRILYRGPYRWRDHGAMSRAYLRPFIEHVVADVARDERLGVYPDDASADHLVRPFEMYLTEESLRELVRELRALIARYRNRMNTEATYNRFDELHPVSGLMLVGRSNAWKAVMMDRPREEPLT